MVGLEPTRCCHRQILSLLRLPFRHIRVPYYVTTMHPQKQENILENLNNYFTVQSLSLNVEKY